MTDIYNFIEGLWINKKIDEIRLNKLKTKGWITQAEKDTIKAKKQKKDKIEKFIPANEIKKTTRKRK